MQFNKNTWCWRFFSIEYRKPSHLETEVRHLICHSFAFPVILVDGFITIHNYTNGTKTLNENEANFLFTCSIKLNIPNRKFFAQTYCSFLNIYDSDVESFIIKVTMNKSKFIQCINKFIFKTLTKAFSSSVIQPRFMKPISEIWEYSFMEGIPSS